MGQPKNSGQSIILSMFILGIVSVLILQVLNSGRLQIKKVRQQKTTDNIALSLATDQARALNAIAALNQGLNLATDRAYLMAMAVSGLTACSVFNPVCAEALKRLAPKVRPFYKKVQALMNSYANQQEQIIAWAERSQQSSHLFFKAQHAPQLLFFETLQGSYFKLPIVREENTKSSIISWALNVPPPYKLQTTHSNNYRMLVASSLHDRGHNQPSLFMWALSEAEILKTNLNEMNFQADLAPAKLFTSVWTRLEKKPAARLMHIPKLNEITIRHD